MVGATFIAMQVGACCVGWRSNDMCGMLCGSMCQLLQDLPILEVRVVLLHSFDEPRLVGIAMQCICLCICALYEGRRLQDR